MAKGDTFESEKRTFEDKESGRTVHQLTGSDAHDHHIYFTNTSFHPDGERLIFGSERTGKPNLFEMNLESGKVKQLTDCEECKPLLACVDPLGKWVYFHDDDGRLSSVPTDWTSLSAPDPFLVLSNGRARFRPGDLVRLADLIEGLWQG